LDRTNRTFFAYQLNDKHNRRGDNKTLRYALKRSQCLHFVPEVIKSVIYGLILWEEQTKKAMIRCKADDYPWFLRTDFFAYQYLFSMLHLLHFAGPILFGNNLVESSVN
jgi:hypothetical protein